MMLGRKYRARTSNDVHKEQLLWRQWLGSEDFKLWCETAGFDPAYVLRKAKAIEAGGIDFANSVMASGEWKQQQRAKQRANILRRKIHHLTQSGANSGFAE